MQEHRKGSQKLAFVDKQKKRKSGENSAVSTTRQLLVWERRIVSFLRQRQEQKIQVEVWVLNSYYYFVAVHHRCRLFQLVCYQLRFF